ncbi:hypothetical protein ACFVHB_15650 [Kitasatospora sp. NPDC127111]|uniref:hypothetical protein n=1 Tax=Kitasatospora sp. NPDC127111 TaxID=3345363 RepID=UPI00362974C1
MTWLRVLAALGILAVAAGALFVFALCTAAARGDRGDHEDHGTGRRGDGSTPRDPVREAAERSGLFRPTGGEE